MKVELGKQDFQNIVDKVSHSVSLEPLPRRRNRPTQCSHSATQPGSIGAENPVQRRNIPTEEDSGAYGPVRGTLRRNRIAEETSEGQGEGGGVGAAY